MRIEYYLIGIKNIILFPVGGHIEADELPHEAALREAYEESGLQVKLHNDEEQLELGESATTT